MCPCKDRSPSSPPWRRSGRSTWRAARWDVRPRRAGGRWPETCAGPSAAFTLFIMAELGEIAFPGANPMLTHALHFGAVLFGVVAWCG